MKKEKITREEYDTIYNVIHKVLDYAREEDITVSEINFITGYTGIEQKKILAYLFCNFEVKEGK